MNKVALYFKSLPLLDAIKYFIFYGLKKFLNPHAKVFYSQHGEDSIILNLIGKKDGFYVDVGCNHPVKESNTFSFYIQQGWRGINIDANETLTNKFKKIRLQDNVIFTAVSDEEGELDFYEFYTDTISTVDKGSIAARSGKSEIKEIKKVKARTLNNILLEQIPERKETIDLLSIDVEGHDLNVLKSLDLNMFRPKLIVVEIEDFNFSNPEQNSVVSHLKGYGYAIEAFDSKNGYFLRDRRMALWSS